jgi:UPF0755 protein
MPLFGDKGDRGARSAADREAARVERERRRALREGLPHPDAPVDDGTGDAAPEAGPPFEWDAAAGDAGAVEVSDRRGHTAPDEDELDDDAGTEPGAGAASDAGGGDDAPGPSAADEADGAAEPEAPAPERQPAAAWPDPRGDGELDPRAQAWQQRRPAPADAPPRADAPAAGADDPGDGAAGHPPAEPARGAADAGDARAAEPTPDGERANGRRAGDAHAPGAETPDGDTANGRHAGDPQATQPFDPVQTPAPRRTLSFPRPQTDTSEWDAPIGTIRKTRGGGDFGSGPYRAQPGAPGYPQYRKLEVRPRRRWLRRIVVILALGLAIAAAAFAFLLFQPKHSAGHGRVVVTVPVGATADQIGDLLEKRGVVRSGFLFSLRSRLSGDRSRLRSGRYTLKEGMSYAAALTALTTAPKAAPVIDVTIPEGPSRREEAPKLRTAGLRGSYLTATRRSSKLNPRDYGAPRGTRSLEGFLYPDTYQLRRSDASARHLVSRQLDAFKENFAKVSMRTARRRNLSRYDVLIIASMIEREALVPRDRRLIAAVIYNRLKQGIPLGIDATLRYALDQWSRPLRVSELNRDTAFNTRKHRGLPPTPIGNPGLPAMRAAANPANVSYLFYVVKPCGNGAHAFSSTDAQFQRDVARYNKARARRGGKDPSHC